jgi:tetratricopeptide (TPR) repeat protein
VQRLGNAVHVNVQLIKASTGAHIWAQSYDRTLQNAFAVEGEIAQTVAHALQIALAPRDIEQLKAMPTQNAAAYDAYLRGEYALERARKNPGDYQTGFDPAIAAFQEAIALDSQFALAYAQLAYAEITKEEYAHLDGRTTRKPELLVSAKQNIDRALQLDEQLPYAHLALGRWHFASGQNREAALEEYRRALALDPRLSEAKARIASSLLKDGRTGEAIQVYLQGLEADPRNYQLLRNLGIAYTMRREYQKAREIDSRIVAIDPADELDACNLALDFLQSAGDMRRARQVLDQLISHLPAGRPKGSRLTSMELMLLTLGRNFSAARSYAENLPRENWETDWSHAQVMGDIEQFAGHTTAARESYQNARVLLLNAIAKDPEEPQAHADLAAVDAALGLKEEALREARRAVELEPVTSSARAGLAWLVNLALVQARLGEHDEAIKRLEELMKMPNAGEAISPWQLKLDPVWDPLRPDARFQKLATPLVKA